MLSYVRSPYCRWAVVKRKTGSQLPCSVIMNANRWKFWTFGVSVEKESLLVRLQVGEREEVVGGTYVCICTIDLYS